MIKRILRKILYANPITRRICQWRIRLVECRKVVYPIIKERILHPNAIFLLLTPEHGNVGDHAIAVSERYYLESVGLRFFEVTDKNIRLLKEYRMLHVFDGRTICIQGGGNLGTLWYGVESVFRAIIVSNPRAKIIGFPNTFYYEDTEWGRKELEKSIEIYNAHSDLHLFAREHMSYEAMKPIYRNVELVPDMVLSLCGYGATMEERDGCLLCLRSDVEKTMQKEQTLLLEKIARKYFGEKIEYTDMVEDHGIAPSEREEAVNGKIRQFQRAQLVITDRLHAMIFCAIAQTPCIVVPSKSHKVRGTYEWIQHLPYIRLVNDYSGLDNVIRELLELNMCQYDNSDLLPYYVKLKEVLQRK